MDAATLLTEWLAHTGLRPSTRTEYQREITSFLTWCTEQTPPVDAIAARPKDIAAWAAARHLHPYLQGRPFTPDTLALIAQDQPEAARSHDRRITALTQYYEAAVRWQLIGMPPNLTVLRSGVPRPAGAKNRLTDTERDALLQAIGSWGPLRSKHWQRDQLAVFLLLEGLRPSQVIRVDIRHLYPQPDGTWQVRAPDDHESTGRQFTLGPMAGEALKAYLDVRPEPAEPGEYALLLNDRRQALQFRWVNRVVGQIAATHALLADRRPTKTGEVPPSVTADAVAHTAKREQVEEG
jgi:integrase